MRLKVNRELIDKWIEDNSPDGIGKLGMLSKIPTNSLAKLRLGWVPKDILKRESLARVLGVAHDELFFSTEDSEAS